MCCFRKKFFIFSISSFFLTLFRDIANKRFFLYYQYFLRLKTMKYCYLIGSLIFLFSKVRISGIIQTGTIWVSKLPSVLNFILYQMYNLTNCLQWSFYLIDLFTFLFSKERFLGLYKLVQYGCANYH